MTDISPGPWEVVERSDTWNVKAGNRCIARLQKKTGAETEARAIAVLPDLLAALEGLKRARILMGDYRDSSVQTTARKNALQVLSKIGGLNED